MNTDKNDWLKKSLQDKFDTEQTPVGDELWSKIEPRIQEKKKNRKAIWMWFLFGALGLGAVGLGLWNDWWITNSVSEQSAVVDQHGTSGQEAGGQKEIDAIENKTLNPTADQAGENEAGELLTNINSKESEEVNEGEKFVRASRNSALSNAEGNIVENPASAVGITMVPSTIDSDNSNSTSIRAEAINETVTKIDTTTLITGISDYSSNIDGTTNHPAEDNNLFLLSSKLDSLNFVRLFEFRSEYINTKEKPLPKRSGWYVSVAYGRHRQLAYPNLNDNLLIRNRADYQLDTARNELQWGLEIDFGKTFKISDKLEGFGALTIGMKQMNFAHRREFGGFEFNGVEVIDVNTIRLTISRIFENSNRSTRLFYPEFKLGLNYQPFKKIPIQFSLGAFGRLHFFKLNEENYNQFELGALAGVAWNIDKKKRFQLNLKTELSLNKIDLEIYKSRIQTAKVGLEYKF